MSEGFKYGTQIKAKMKIIRVHNQERKQHKYVYIYIRVFHLPRLSPILLFKILKLCLTIKLTDMEKNCIFPFLS